jgi:NAD(P)-dependent dehydrogenase (short-subunit alcohol dehydrogenase family)
MKVAITGSTRGIGWALFDYFSKKGHTCYGFSRSNGYDIDQADARLQIIQKIRDCDIFVNNAYSNYNDSQLLLLQAVYHSWLGQDKIIINISSRITDWPANVNEAPLEYYETKSRQDEFCAGKRRFPQILNLRMGMTDTDRVKTFTRDKMHPNDIASVVDFALNSPLRITSITFGL